MDGRFNYSEETRIEVARLFALGHGDAHLHDSTLQLGLESLDVHELKELERIQLPLRLLHQTSPIEVSGLEGQLAIDDGPTDAGISRDLDVAEMRDGPGLGTEHDRGGAAQRTIIFVGGDAGIGIALIAKFVHGRFVSQSDDLTIAWRIRRPTLLMPHVP